jgi:hypothetical protein
LAEAERWDEISDQVTALRNQTDRDNTIWGEAWMALRDKNPNADPLDCPFDYIVTFATVTKLEWSEGNNPEAKTSTGYYRIGVNYPGKSGLFVYHQYCNEGVVNQIAEVQTLDEAKAAAQAHRIEEAKATRARI